MGRPKRNTRHTQPIGDYTMIFALLFLLGCTTVRYDAQARITSLAAGGSEGEFYATADLYCGPLLFPLLHHDKWWPVDTRILRCQAPLNIRSKKLAECAPVADVSILQLSTTQAQGNNFVIERYNTYCLKTILAAGESGWTPTE
jgi:hypothetical protein